MDLLCSVNWIALLVLAITLLLFKVLNQLAMKINWTFVVLISMVMGAVIGLVFASDNNSYLVWVDLIGDIYINVITALVAPVILISIMSGFISLNSKEKMKSIGLTSVLWLLASSAAAIVLSYIFGAITGLGKGAEAVFADIASVSDSTISSYEELATSFDKVILKFFPTNVIGDLSNDNVVAIIIIAIAVAVAYVGISSEEGEEKVAAFKNLVEALKNIIYRILAFVIDLTPFAVLCLVAGSASQIFEDKKSLVQLVLLVVMIYVVCLVHSYGFNAIIIKCVAKLSPLKFFKKILPAQITAFTTSSSVGSIPASIECQRKSVGIDEEISNFTTSLGTTIGMPGCTCVWPILLAIFYTNAMGIAWTVSDYVMLAVVCLILSLGSAGVPGIGVVSAMAVFKAVNLPIAAIVLLVPINNISDMIRTFDNVTAGNVTAAIVARKMGTLDDNIFNAEEKKGENA